jgi:hypothetical protein
MKKNPLRGKSEAQAGQDLFALEVCKNKTYIEIGGSHPRRINNTFNLDSNHGWKGFSIELNDKWNNAWDTSSRNNPCYFKNALTFDYLAAIREQGMNTKVGYLSCDIEPPNNTYAALQRVIGQGVEFECITFEHDWYNFPDTTFNEQATDFLKKHGYKIAVRDVFCKKSWLPYETWYVREDADFNEIDFQEWRAQAVKSLE